MSLVAGKKEGKQIMILLFFIDYLVLNLFCFVFFFFFCGIFQLLFLSLGIEVVLTLWNL